MGHTTSGQSSASCPKSCHKTRGGKRHSKSSKKIEKSEGQVNIFFGNLTSWSSHAEDYVKNLTDDIIMLAEVHKDKSDMLELIKKQIIHGRIATGAPAVPSTTSDSGTSGGVLTMVAKHWHSNPIASSDPQGRLTPGSRLTGRSVTIDERDVLMLSGYFESGKDLHSGENRKLTMDIDYISRSGKRPFVLGADFNNKPEEGQNNPIPVMCRCTELGGFQPNTLDTKKMLENCARQVWPKCRNNTKK